MSLWSQFRVDASRHVSRGAGQSAVAAAAYRAGEKLYDARSQETHDYTRRYGVVASGLVMPEGGGPDWTREQLWNAAEAAERRKDSRTARKVEMALPAEMDAAQRQELAQAWAGELANRYRVAVDWAIHLPDQEGDRRNHHVHLMMTTREIGAAGFAGKAALELSNADQKRRGLAVGDDAIFELRALLAERLNQVAERHGLDLRADPRSYADRGIDLTPTKHVGVHAVAMDRRGFEAERAEDHAEIRRENARRIVARPELVLETLTRTEAVFSRHDMAREVSRHIDDAEQFRMVLARLDASPELVRLSEGVSGAPARLTTREMVAAETRMMEAAAALAAEPTHGVSARQGAAALARHGHLSEEQRAAVAHLAAPGRLAAVAGGAGTGNRPRWRRRGRRWEAAGLRVRGAALAGKAAEALQGSAGIESRTLHALEYGWRHGRDPLGGRDVLVIDEAGMVGSRQLGRVLAEAREAGAKVVLVGDARQLQPIEAGAAFRAVAEQVGVAEISAVRRQREPWAREASQAFAQGAVGAGLAAYAARGQVRLVESREAAKAAIARDAVAAGIGGRRSGHQPDPGAHQPGRAGAQRAGAGGAAAHWRAGRRGAVPDGARRAPLRRRGSPRVPRNDRALGVKNGTLATVEQAAPGRLVARLDGGGAGQRRAGGLRADRSRLCGDLAQGAGGDGGAGLRAGLGRDGPAPGLCRHDAAPRSGDAVCRARRLPCMQAALARRLSRARPKASTLDFAERRGFETPKAWSETRGLGWSAGGGAARRGVAARRAGGRRSAASVGRPGAAPGRAHG